MHPATFAVAAIAVIALIAGEWFLYDCYDR